MSRWREPLALAALVAVPLLVLFLAWAERARRRALDAVVAATLQDAVVLGVDPRRRRLRAWLVVAAVAALVVALAGPRWGVAWEEVRREGVDVVVALDTSRSMLAPDVRPDRLSRAKLGVRDLAAAARGDRLGLVAFAGTAFLQCPLTLDRVAFADSLDAVQVGIIPRGGTNLGAALDAALDAFEGREGRHQAVVLITDGEPTEGDVDAAVAKAVERGVRVFTVGIGTAEGELIPGEGGAFFKNRQGQPVKTRLDEGLLQQVATRTGGAYLHAAGPSLGIADLYRTHIATMERRQLGSTLTRRAEERYRWPLAVALVLLVVEASLGDAPPASRRRTALAQAAAAAALFVVGSGFLDPHAAGREGNRLYAEGQYDEAAKRYQEALVDEPDSARLHLNLGAAEYRAQRLDAARRALEAVPPDAADPARTARRFYDLGNVQFREGQALAEKQPQQALQRWTDALASYRRALEASPDDADAKWNHELVTRRAEELRKKLEEQQQQQQKQDGQQQKDRQPNDQRQQGQQDQQGEQQDDGEQQPKGDQQRQASGEGQQKPPDHDGEPRDGQQQNQQQAARDAQPPSPEDGHGAEAGQAGQAARPGEMTPQEAAALLDGEREHEVQPGEIVRRMAPARVAEPTEDW